MKSIARWLLLLVVFGALTGGCTGSPTQEAAPSGAAAQKEPPPEPGTPKTQATQPRVKPDPSAQITEITQKEIDQAQAVVILYFDAVINQDQAVIDFLWAGKPAPATKPGPKGTRAAIMQEIKPLKGEIRNDLPTVYFEVQVDLGENPGGAWGPGINHRWVEVVKTREGWKIYAVPTSPPTL